MNKYDIKLLLLNEFEEQQIDDNIIVDHFLNWDILKCDTNFNDKNKKILEIIFKFIDKIIINYLIN